MAKEEKVESKVEVKEKTVSVEMSPEQKQAFVEFMAKRDADEAEAKAKEAIKAENDRPAVVNLRFRHNINGNPYGPGTVKTTAQIAGKLLAQDELAWADLLKAKDGGNHLVQMAMNGGFKVHKNVGDSAMGALK